MEKGTRHRRRESLRASRGRRAGLRPKWKTTTRTIALSTRSHSSVWPQCSFVLHPGILCPLGHAVSAWSHRLDIADEAVRIMSAPQYRPAIRVFVTYEFMCVQLFGKSATHPPRLLPLGTAQYDELAFVPRAELSPAEERLVACEGWDGDLWPRARYVDEEGNVEPAHASHLLPVARRDCGAR